MPKMMELAYEMSRTIDNKKTWFTTAYFGWVKFDLEPAALAAVEEVLKRDEEVIRYMVLKTVRENTIAQKRSMSRPARARDAAPTEEGEAAAPANPEEIDKQIEALVTE
jgi:ribosomal protein S6